MWPEDSGWGRLLLRVLSVPLIKLEPTGRPVGGAASPHRDKEVISWNVPPEDLKMASCMRSPPHLLHLEMDEGKSAALSGDVVWSGDTSS